MTELGLLYLGAGTILFFFWAYGIVSFVRDVKNRVVPGVRGALARRREERREEEREQEREEQERQLY